MQTNLITVWAIGMSALALVLAGVLIGKSLQQTSGENATTGPAATEQGGAPLVDMYQVPTWLQDAPKEWRSPFLGPNEGYAILFDYDVRELLVESCSHAGFFNQKTNRPVEQIGFQCERILTAALIEFNDEGVLVERKDGSQLHVVVKPETINDVASLVLQFDGHAMALVAGQPNDLLQEIAGTAQMKEQKRLMYEFSEQQIRQERAQLAAVNEDGIPRFSLPEAALRQQEEARRADPAAESP